MWNNVDSLETSLLNSEGCVGSWLTWVAWISVFVGTRGGFGQKVAWGEWVEWIYKMFA